MTGLKWFAGGKERREQAVAIIDEVIETIGDKSDYADLKQVLHSYRTELADSRSATPYILSRMSLEISEVVRKDQLTLSPFIEERMAEVRKLLAIPIDVIREDFLVLRLSCPLRKGRSGKKVLFQPVEEQRKTLKS